MRRLTLLMICFGLPGTAFGHAAGPRYVVDLGWKTDQISRGLGLDMNLGLRRRGQPRIENHEGRRCVVGRLFGFDVADEFAFDIDETVVLELQFAARSSKEFNVAYDRNGTANSISIHDIGSSSDGPWLTEKVALKRARFANRGSFGTDLAIGSARRGGPLTLCSIRLERSHQTPEPADFGELNLRIIDAATGAPSQARVGLYDASGRMPVPSSDALKVRFFTEDVRQLTVRSGAYWPDHNRHVFYVDGSYRARLPVGKYHLVAMKGFEYRVVRESFEIGAGESEEMQVSLERWTDLPAAGWYSGDTHVHIRREAADNARLLAMVAAEDLHVASVLQVGNIHTIHARQYAWGEKGRYRRGLHALVSGQEGPRTSHRGHTISLNLRRPIRSPERYFLYHEVLEAMHRQGGLTGYAHLATDIFKVHRGLAVDVPFELVDFLEIFQMGVLGVGRWYEFLNLGFKLAPSGGSDYPYLDLAGTVRNYVHLEGDYSPQAWFDGLAAGRTFVTNGPVLDLAANGHGIGSELQVPKGEVIRVQARASINPDIGRLGRLELVVNGDVVKRARKGSDDRERLHLDHTLRPRDSLWIAARVMGQRLEGADRAQAHSAPIYVRVEGRRFWKISDVEQTVKRQRRHLQELVNAPLHVDSEPESTETVEILRQEWPKQRVLLEKRITEANAAYDALLRELRSSSDQDGFAETDGATVGGELR